MNPTRYLQVTEIAALLRLALREAFPGIRFSVRTRRYAGGSSVDVRWTDGPSALLVDALVRRFEGKSFDGMTDSTRYAAMTLDSQPVSMTSWIQTQRELSPAQYARAQAQAERLNRDIHWSTQRLSDRLAAHHSPTAARVAFVRASNVVELRRNAA